MAFPPAKFSRVTSHAKPRYQLYYPGFNLHNSCWIPGDWVTVPEADWKKRKTAHEKLFSMVRAELKTQHHRGKGTTVKGLTEAQKQAYEVYSGNQTFWGWYKNKAPFAGSVKMAGNSPQENQITWLRRLGVKFPRFIKSGPKGKPKDQFRGIRFPNDLIETNTLATAYDDASAVVAFNRANEQSAFDAFVDGVAKREKGTLNLGSTFDAQMVMHMLIEQEETIIRAEWDKSVGRDWLEIDLGAEKTLYVSMRTRLKQAMGSSFQTLYDSQRKSHNEGARHNLGDHGMLFSFVLPVFQDDGSHEPWGPRDVPWGHKE